MRFNINDTRDYFNNVSRGFLLAIGLVVIAGLIAATFIYGDSNPASQNQDQTQGSEQSETAGDDAQNPATTQGNGGTDTTTNDDGAATATDTDEEANKPNELAATGPESLAFIVTAILGVLTFGYLYTQSNLKDQLSN